MPAIPAQIWWSRNLLQSCTAFRWHFIGLFWPGTAHLYSLKRYEFVCEAQAMFEHLRSDVDNSKRRLVMVNKCVKTLLWWNSCCMIWEWIIRECRRYKMTFHHLFHSRMVEFLIWSLIFGLQVSVFLNDRWIWEYVRHWDVLHSWSLCSRDACIDHLLPFFRHTSIKQHRQPDHCDWHTNMISSSVSLESLRWCLTLMSVFVQRWHHALSLSQCVSISRPLLFCPPAFLQLQQWIMSVNVISFYEDQNGCEEAFRCLSGCQTLWMDLMITESLCSGV